MILTRIVTLFLATTVVCAGDFFEIQVLDQQSGRGVPLVELETVNHVKFITDNAGRVAIAEPSLNNQLVFFSVRSHGYEFPKDGFGMRGTRLKVTPGKKETLKVKRINVAERLYRITGEGLYRDSILLGYNSPIREPLLNAQVFGQDSIQRVILKDQIHWFWGDTLRVSYPLGNFRMSGAVSDLPVRGGLPPETGINLQYYTNHEGFCKGMFPIEPKGDLIWADGFVVLPDASGGEQMLAHYQRLKGLGQPLARGLAIYDSSRNEFEKLAELPLEEKWRFPHGHPVTLSGYLYFGISFPTVRAPASTNALLQPNQYEAFTCLRAGRVDRDSSGKVVYRWTTDEEPSTPKAEADLVKAGQLRVEEAHFQPRDVESGNVILIHAGNVTWNAWRKRWILIGVQQFGTSMLGEIWYGEAESPTGPWTKVRKIVTHDRYSFYNPAHHPFFDEEGGRIIYFEGTYTAEFSGNPSPTARYDYNQIMYRLDLADERLQSLR